MDLVEPGFRRLHRDADFVVSHLAAEGIRSGQVLSVEPETAVWATCGEIGAGILSLKTTIRAIV